MVKLKGLVNREQVTYALLVVLIFLGAVSLSQVAEINKLTREIGSQEEELANLQTTLYEIEETLRRQNITLSLLENDHIVKAANMIISQVGLEYFEQYFYAPNVTTPKFNTNVTWVLFKYRIQVGNYSTEWVVDFWFHPKYVQIHGIPKEGNLQPFTITAEEAQEHAVKGGLPGGPFNLESEIIYTGIADYSPTKGHEDKYVWRVVSWKDPPWASVRKRQTAYVDPHSGRVYTILQGGRTILEEDVDSLEKALSHGVDGYLKLNYVGLPERINLTESSSLTFTLQITHISHVENRADAKITLDPHKTDTYWIDTRIRNQLRDYLTYEPSGVFTLKAGETMNITCTLYTPDLDEELSFRKRSLRGLGMSTEKTLIVYDPGE